MHRKILKILKSFKNALVSTEQPDVNGGQTFKRQRSNIRAEEVREFKFVLTSEELECPHLTYYLFSLLLISV